MSGSNVDFYDAMYTFSRLFAAGLPIDSGAVRVAVVTYSTTSSISFQLNQYSNSQQVCQFTRV